MKIVHLHTHSHYSLLDGLAKIPDLVAKAARLKSPALALTDHGVMYGAVEFYQTCKSAGIKPIIGCELYVARRSMFDKERKLDAKPFHLTVLAKNMQGYKNLLKLVSKSHLEGFYYKPRIDKKLLKKHSDGLIILSGCLASEFGTAAKEKNFEKALEIAKEYLEIVGEENYYLEIQPHSMAEQLKANSVASKVAKSINRPLVVTNDIHYLNKDDTDTHEILLAINTGKDIDDSERMSLKEASIYMMSAEEITKAVPNSETAVLESEKIADRVDLKLEFGKSILPEFPLPKGEKDSKKFLIKKANLGLKKFYGGKENFADAKKRMEYELSIIEKTGFGDYFLIVSDIVTWAKKNGISVGPGRGSAAGSLVSYVLEITALDPLKYNLIFERFLNPERISMPDIDLDFADDRRGEVIEYIKKRYGENHVAQIITFGIMKARLSVRDVTRAFGLPYSLGDRIAKLIPPTSELEEAVKNISELSKLYKEDPDAKKVIETAKKLEGVARHASTHAAGVVISKDPLTEYVPLQRSTTGDNGSATTQYDMKMIEKIGLLKMDILGLANLTIMKNTQRIIKKVYREDIDVNNIPLNDKKTFKLLSKANTVGVFQLESAGMQRYLRELKPTEIEDIISMVALYRPGPIDAIPEFIEGKHARRKISYLHPSLKPILKNTYGVIVTQDQVLEIARSFAGFTYSEADLLRKAVGKKIKKLLNEQRGKFIKGAVKTHGISEGKASQVWDFIEPFARYGFNRAHAASYALISYQTAYLKANYPECFMAALLTSEHKDLDKVAVAVAEAERMGIKVLKPDINESFVEFGVVKKEGGSSKDKNIKKYIRFGLGAIKNVGDKAGEMIVKERLENGRYKSLEDFLTRMDGQVINKKIIESLAKAGALSVFEEPQKILNGIDEIIKFNQLASKQKANGQIDLFGTKIKVESGKLKLNDCPPAAKKQKLAWEKELLGIYLSEHPLKQYIDKLPAGTTLIGDLKDEMVGEYVRIAGVVETIKKITTKNNQNMAFVGLEDLSGSTEIVVFPSILEKKADLLEDNFPIVVDGKVSTKDGALKILASNIYKIDDKLPNIVKKSTNGNGAKNNGGNGYNGFERSRQKNGGNGRTQKTPLVITIPKKADKTVMNELKKTLEKYPGGNKVVLFIPHNGDMHKVTAKLQISIREELIKKIQKIVGKKNVKYRQTDL